MEYINKQSLKAICGFVATHLRLKASLEFVRTSEDHKVGIFFEDVVMWMGDVDSALKMDDDRKSLVNVDDVFKK